MDWDQSAAANLRKGQAEPEWDAWFATPGDADDFIFYWEEGGCSSK